MRIAALGLLSLLPGVPAPAAAAVVREAPPEQRTAPVSVFRNYVAFIEGWIEDRGPFWFLVDTGANRSALDSSMAAQLGLKEGPATAVQGSAGTIEARTVQVPRLSIGDLIFRDLSPTVYDLSASLAPEGQRLAGIIGSDVLGSYAVHFDTSCGRVVFAPTAAHLTSLEDALVVPFELDSGIPRIDAAIDGVSVPLRLDTGASIEVSGTTFVNITQAFYERLLAHDPSLVPIRHFTASGTGGEIRIPVVQSGNLTLAGATVPAPQLIVQQPVGYFASPEAVGFLGAYSLRTWGGFIVDYPSRRIVLLPEQNARCAGLQPQTR